MFDSELMVARRDLNHCRLPAAEIFESEVGAAELDCNPSPLLRSVRPLKPRGKATRDHRCSEFNRCRFRSHLAGVEPAPGRHAEGESTQPVLQAVSGGPGEHAGISSRSRR